jgi:hypothetical protein
LDPLVNPGSIPSPHQHQIVGGNGFNASMTTGDVSGTASCTTCAFSKDFSNYWTANLYFKARNGTYRRVKQLGAANQFSDNFSTQIDGGVLVYYVSAQPGNVTAFKPVNITLGLEFVQDARLTGIIGLPHARRRPNKTQSRHFP